MTAINSVRRKKAGMTLIEVLVVLIIISIGLLGVAGLQVATVKQTNNAGLRSQALVLMQDMVERIRANPDGVSSNAESIVDSDVVIGSYNKIPNSPFPTTGVSACSGGTGCSSGQIALNDLFSWSQMLKNGLPVSDATLKANTFVCLDSNSADGVPCDGSGSVIVIQVAWDEINSIDDATVQTMMMEFEP